MPEPPMMPSTDLVMSPRFTVRRTKRKGRQIGALRRQAQFCSDRAQCTVRPHLLLGEVQQPGEHDQEDHHLEADALARVEVRLGRPHQEGRDVLGILLHGLRRAVVIGHLPVLQRRRHGDVVAGEIFVVVAVRRQLEALGRVLVAAQQGGDVVRPLLLVLRDRVEDEPGEAALKLRALASIDMSGGAPPLAALAASSLANGAGK